MWMNVRRVLQCVMVRVCVRTRLGATSVFVDQVTGETAHTVKMRMSVHQVATGVTPTLVAATSLALISANATRASMEMDTLVLTLMSVL